MRRFLLLVWLLLPFAAWAYHEGPGQDRTRLDEAYRLAREAHARVTAGDVTAENYAEAVDLYEKALQEMPAGAGLEHERRQLRLELDKARLLAAKLPEARSDLQQLVADMQADPNADRDVLDEARRTLASSQYYTTWLMRLEGLPREAWEPEIEAARQNYRLLSDHARTKGDKADAARNIEDLEAAVRLARLELKDLQGLPLPSQ